MPILEQIDTVGNVTGFTYDGFSDLVIETDPLGNTANFSYDSRGHLVGKQDLNGHNWGWSYDSFGEPITATSPIESHNGQMTSMVYDVLGRLTKRTEPDLVSSWVYDTATGGPSAGTGSCIGRLSTATATGAMTVSGGYSRQMTYDTLCRPRHTTVQLGNNSYTTATTFDSGGRPSEMHYPDGFSINEDYNAQGYWSEVDGPGGTSQPIDTVTQRDAWLHPLQSVTGDQVSTHRAYDPNFGRIQAINTYPAGSSAATLQSLNYSFDSIGNLQSRADTVNGLSETYSYDPLNELTLVTATTTGNSTPSYSHFAYEQAGGQSGSGNPDGTYRVSVKASVGDYSYTYSSASSYLLAGVSDSWVDNPFSYDIDGNTLTDESARTYTWTSFDMPSTIKKGSTITYFAYDPEHRRIQQGTTTSSSSPESNATPTVNYFWVGSAHFEEVLSSSGTLWRDYVSGPDGSMASYYNGQVYYIHGDHQNSSNVETTGSGNFNSFSGGDCYDPWGKRRFCTGAADSGDTLTGSPENTRGYTGEEQLDAFDLVHLNNRLYDPEIGRFVSQDPAGLGGGQNPYAYTGNNPMSRTDRNGLDDCGGGGVDSDGDPIVPVCGFSGGLGFTGVGFQNWGGGEFAAFGPGPFPVLTSTGKLLAQNNSAVGGSSNSSKNNQANGCGAAGNCTGNSTDAGGCVNGGYCTTGGVACQPGSSDCGWVDPYETSWDSMVPGSNGQPIYQVTVEGNATKDGSVDAMSGGTTMAGPVLDFLKLSSLGAFAGVGGITVIIGEGLGAASGYRSGGFKGALNGAVISGAAGVVGGRLVAAASNFGGAARFAASSVASGAASATGYIAGAWGDGKSASIGNIGIAFGIGSLVPVFSGEAAGAALGELPDGFEAAFATNSGVMGIAADAVTEGATQGP